MTDENKPKCPDCNDTGLTPLYNPDGTLSGDVDACECGFGRDDDHADTDEPECPDHWHCDPVLAAHNCDQGTVHRQQNVRVAVDRTKPCPTCKVEPDTSYHVKVVWNQEVEPSYYTFDDKKAADAFMEGLEAHDGWLEADSIELVLPTVAAAPPKTKIEEVHVVFDGPPGPVAGRFVEVETPDGRSIAAGEWRERPDGYWVLVLRVERSAQ